MYIYLIDMYIYLKYIHMYLGLVHTYVLGLGTIIFSSNRVWNLIVEITG